MNVRRGRRVGIRGPKGKKIAVMRSKVNMLFSLTVEFDAIEMPLYKWRLV
jgi:hypothetical protein